MKLLYMIFGFLALALGVLGAFLPVLPTTPFILLAAMFFSKSSPRYHKWLLSTKLFGPIIYNWEQNHCIGVKTKRLALTMLVLFGGSSIVIVPLLWVKGLTFVLVAYAAYFVTKIPACFPAVERENS